MSSTTNQSHKFRRLTQIVKLFFILISPMLFTACSSFAKQSQTQNEAKEATTALTENNHSLGELAPDFTLSDLQGKELTFSSLKGKMVVMHFATTWCPFCNAEAPYLEEMYQQYRDQGVEVLIVDVKEPQNLVQEKLQNRFKLTFPILLDEDGSVAASYAPQGVLPDLSRDEVVLASNLLIDREGKIQFYSLLDSKNFDAELIDLKSKLNELL